MKLKLANVNKLLTTVLAHLPAGLALSAVPDILTGRVLTACKTTDDCCLLIYHSWVIRELDRRALLGNVVKHNDFRPVETLDASIPYPATNTALFSCRDARKRYRVPPYETVEAGSWAMRCSTHDETVFLHSAVPLLGSARRSYRSIAICRKRVTVKTALLNAGTTECLDEKSIQFQLLQAWLTLRAPDNLSSEEPLLAGATITWAVLKGPGMLRKEIIGPSLVLETSSVSAVYRACAHASGGQKNLLFHVGTLGDP